MSKIGNIQNKLDTAFLPGEMANVLLIRLQLDFYVWLFVREIKTQLLRTDNSQPSLAQDTFYYHGTLFISAGHVSLALDSATI